MPIPDYQTIMLPLLQLAADQKEHRFRDAIEHLSTLFELTEAERAEMLPSGAAPLFANRVGWARFYLKQAGLLESPRRGQFKITADGMGLLIKSPAKITLAVLEQYPAFVESRSRKNPSNESKDASPSHAANALMLEETTPEDQLADAYRRIRAELENELLEQIKASSPAFFEQLVVDLLVRMGYGGSRQDAGRAVGRSGDGGIDGIIKEDKLGLDLIYLQAKRWEGTVGRPEIQKFAGALQGHRANKGVFITTSSYTREALEYVELINTKIILIDGNQLTRLMFEHGVGVSTVGVYELKQIDSDYFESI
ncbi:restriction endonuclease [Chitinilyticum litopenaei]|uniref:restriction endonuclease n=1 Tax=Chitinilyticum litopenaei TaxID=1121276 RepID=UPI00041E9861|nr:restriction endonuclease [Chitinilyticum litopenaei]